MSPRLLDLLESSEVSAVAPEVEELAVIVKKRLVRRRRAIATAPILAAVVLFGGFYLVTRDDASTYAVGADGDQRGVTVAQTPVPTDNAQPAHEPSTDTTVDEVGETTATHSPDVPGQDGIPKPESGIDSEPQPQVGTAFREDFTGNDGLNRFTYGVYHRGVGQQVVGDEPEVWGDGNAQNAHGGEWTGDHDLTCGSPETQRPLGSSAAEGLIDFAPQTLTYTCRDHLMTSMGDVDGYSVVWFSPNQLFSSDVVTRVSWDVNVTDLGGRQWWEVSIVPTGENFLATADWLADTAGIDSYAPGAVIVGNGPFGSSPNITVDNKGVYDGWRELCGEYGLDTEGCNDKKLRRTFSITDNEDGTLTFDFGGSLSLTTEGRFPDEFRVYFKDHNYTPDKDGEPIGYTWHWDNIFIE